MAKIQYQTFDFAKETQALIGVADSIIHEYQAQGFDLTIRQLYYQFVSRDILANTQKNYSKLGSIINDARLAGMLDWNAIVDRTRNVMSLNHWKSPEDIVQSTAHQYREDIWASQKFRVEVWIEKDALTGILASVCPEFDVPYFSCRGYTSQSEMWSAGQRIVNRAKKGQGTVILHFGDHDPSGIDMTRDIEDRLLMFTSHHLQSEQPVFEIQRLALTMDQITQYKPPPNFAKTTDSRFKEYMKKYGTSSWELDALDPIVLADLIRQAIRSLVDRREMRKSVAQQEENRKQLTQVSANWSKAVEACQ